MKKHKNKIIAGVIIAIVLAFVFWYGGDAPGLRGWTPQPKGSVNVITEDAPIKTEMPEVTDEPAETPAPSEPKKEEIKEAEQKVSEIPIKQADEAATEENKPQNTDNTPMTPAEKEALAERIAEESNVSRVQNGSRTYSEANGMVINESTGKDKYLTDPVPEGKPLPIEPQDAVISDKELTCTLSVRCDTILNNIAWLDKDKVDIVPKDGVIFAEKTVTFYEGESVFNLLMREMKRNKIHMEFENTPIYNSAYIEGIANLYEFDCGELSGWMYKVNDWFPNYGCSRYQLKAGDRVEWVYTCDLGVDVGGYYAASGN
ncbi:MAG: DUF4430 domain-containing protein [Clostridia bacterium]|nr:DUF4430 domain-containing protein [Clostridia bacterium]